MLQAPRKRRDRAIGDRGGSGKAADEGKQEREGRKEEKERTGRPAGDLVQEAVARLRAHNERVKRQAQVGIDQIARGEFIEEGEMDARVERMLQS